MDKRNLMLFVAINLLIEEEESEEEEMERRCRRRKANSMSLSGNEEGAFNTLICRHLAENDSKFKEYFRLTPHLFNYVLDNIRDEITTNVCNRHKVSISAEQKLCLTLRYLATGKCFRSLAFQFRICHSWINLIIKNVLNCITKKLIKHTLLTPTEEQFKMNVEKFYTRWNYPNCIGAINGKHIRIKCPNNSGSLFFNYKEYYSVVLLAIVDAECKFVAIDVGSYGREGDAGIFLKSKFGQQIRKKKFNIPKPAALPETEIILPHVILGDEAFAIHENLMKPYPRNQSLTDKSKAIYNYRHSRARRTTENAFGIMCAYFRIFFTPIATKVTAIDDIITASCILHNILRTSKVLAPSQIDFNDHSLPLPQSNLMAIRTGGLGRLSENAADVRTNFKNYFNGCGAVSWQEEEIYS